MIATSQETERTILRAHDVFDPAVGDATFYVALQYARGFIGDVEYSRPLDMAAAMTDLGNLEAGLLQPDVVRRLGELLFRGLADHEEIMRALTLALAVPPDDVAPLYIRIDSDLADRLPWETLFHGDEGFLVLDRRWPIGRIVGSSLERRLERAFEPPLKMLVLLAAAGVSAQPEWEALQNAIRKAPVEVHVKVLVCETSLRRDIEALGDQRVTVDLLQSDAQLTHQIAAFAPHILHLFCHGSVEDGPHLLLATPNDKDAELIDSSGVSLSPRQLTEQLDIDHIWLVTLNCCQGATAPLAGHSFARSLVRLGVPAAIAMREIVASDVARDFSEAFYPALFEEVAACVGAGGFATELLWARALQSPRQQLCESRRGRRPLRKAAAETKEWTLPILYLAPERFKLLGPAATPVPAAPAAHQNRRHLLDELNVVRGYRDFAATLPETPRTILDRLDARIAELEAQLGST